MTWPFIGFLAWSGFAACAVVGLWFLVVLSVHLITRKGRV